MTLSIMCAGAAGGSALVLLLSAGAVLAEPTTPPPAADVEATERGRIIYQACRPCHDVGAGAKHKTGPHLNGLFGARAGERDGYASSVPMIVAGRNGLIWDEATLETYLQGPTDLVPGAEMSLIGVMDEGERRDLIAFLAEASQEGATFRSRPEPVLHPSRRKTWE